MYVRNRTNSPTLSLRSPREWTTAHAQSIEPANKPPVITTFWAVFSKFSEAVDFHSAAWGQDNVYSYTTNVQISKWFNNVSMYLSDCWTYFFGGLTANRRMDVGLLCSLEVYVVSSYCYTSHPPFINQPTVPSQF